MYRLIIKMPFQPEHHIFTLHYPIMEMMQPQFRDHKLSFIGDITPDELIEKLRSEGADIPNFPNQGDNDD